MARIVKRTFEGQRLRLDGNEYEDCVFRRCTLVFTATKLVTLHACSLVDCHWKFEGSAAIALEFFEAMYHADANGTEFVERVFAVIRQGDASEHQRLTEFHA